MKLKLIALDIDGTLTNDEKKITADTLSTLLKFQEQGIRAPPAPARPAPGLPPAARAPDLYPDFILQPVSCALVTTTASSWPTTAEKS